MIFQPNALPTLIGSLPHGDHEKATRLVFEYMPEIPLWVQLPRYPEERLLSQFCEGLPGIRGKGDSLCFDTKATGFEKELLSFFEEYLAVTEAGTPIENSIFAFSEKTGRGFKAFLEAARAANPKPRALKGQITGPFTMLTGLKDSDGKLSYFDPRLREAVVKGISLKARYQVEAMRKVNDNAIVFLDEPALAGFGSSALVGITREDTVADLTEVMDEVHKAGGIVGIHVCANTDWSVVLSTPLDILSFDSYGFFDRFMLFKDELLGFLDSGKSIAWGLVPTLSREDLENENVASLKARWDAQVEKTGAEPDIVRRQALITPSCGTGLLSPELSLRALELTRDLSKAIRS